MKVDVFFNLQYNDVTPEDSENRLICSWNHSEQEGLMLVLIVNEVKCLGVRSLDLYARDDTSAAPTLRISLNNGVQEILAAIDAKASDLLQIIRTSNPDIESLLDQHPSFSKSELDKVVEPAQPITVATKRL